MLNSPLSALPRANRSNRSMRLSVSALAVFLMTASASTPLPALAARWQSEDEVLQTSGDSDQVNPSSALPTKPLSVAVQTASNLFDDLESDKFKLREAATVELARRGQTVLPELVDRYFSAPPETVYRIRKILEGVSSSGGEETFLRATSLLLALYSSSDQAMADRIEILKAQWRQRRKEEAIKAIVDAGGKIISAYNTQPQLIQATVLRKKRTIADSTPAVPQEPQKPKLNLRQQRALVDQILENSRDQNRDFIIKKSQSMDLATSDFQYGNQFNRSQPISIQFPDRWAAEGAVLEKLRELDTPVVLTLEQTQLTDEHWRIIKDSEAIVAVELKSVRLPEKATLAFPETVRAVTLEGYELETDFCLSLGPLSDLGILQLTNCVLNEDAVSALNRLKRVSAIFVGFNDIKVESKAIAPLAQLTRAREIKMINARLTEDAQEALVSMKQLQSLNLSSMTLDENFFACLTRMRRLNQLELYGCKFDVDAFERLEATRRVRINFQPKAFLGVGPADVGLQGVANCQIARIVAGSAAAGGGLKVGDVIKSIDGKSVKTFKDVRLQIAQYDPGGKMDLEIQRGAKVVNLTIALGENSLNPTGR